MVFQLVGWPWIVGCEVELPKNQCRQPDWLVLHMPSIMILWRKSKNRDLCNPLEHVDIQLLHEFKDQVRIFYNYKSYNICQLTPSSHHHPKLGIYTQTLDEHSFFQLDLFSHILFYLPTLSKRCSSILPPFPIIKSLLQYFSKVVN